jgi:hypothetical protein
VTAVLKNLLVDRRFWYQRLREDVTQSGFPNAGIADETDFHVRDVLNTYAAHLTYQIRSSYPKVFLYRGNISDFDG